MARNPRDWSLAYPAALLLGAIQLLAPSTGHAARPGERAVTSQLPPSVQPADPATQARVNDWLEASGSGWSPNLGQIADAEGRPADDVLYMASTRDARVYVTRTGLRHLFISSRENEAEDETGEEHRSAPRVGGRSLENEPSTYDWARLELSLVGARIRPERAEARGEIEGQGTENFYLAHCPDGVLDVPGYARVTFPDVYKGVDWVVRSDADGGVHHDFVVAPGADPAAIRLRYEGATSLVVSADGQSLIVRTALGEVREGALSCYQRDAGRPVAARFELSGDVVTMRVGEYDRSRPLTIDPPLVWSTYYGGTDYDGPRAIYCDNVNGTVYVVGYCASLDLPVFNPGGTYYQGTEAGDRDGFIWKFTQLGKRLWATYYGGGGGEGISDCVVDPVGNLYVTGTTTSTNMPLQVLAGAYNQPSMSGPTEGFIVKFNAAGVRQWATFYGGSSFDNLNGITADATGRLFICGDTSSPNFPILNPGGAFMQATIASATDAFVVRFGANDALQWSTYLGANDDEYANGIIANAGSVYVTGTTQSSSFPTFNPGGGAYFQGALSGTGDAFISRFSLAGAMQWSTYFGGSGWDIGDEPAVDATGHAYLYGNTPSTDLPTYDPGGGAYYQPANAGDDFFLAKFDSVNAPIWSTYFGGTAQEVINGPTGKPITVDGQGRVTITGLTASTDYPLMNAANSYFDNSYDGSFDACITQFGNNSALLWSTYWGTVSTDFGTGVAANGEGCVFATGESVELGSLITVNSGLGAWYQAANAGSDDGFIAKFCSPSSACCIGNTCVAVSSPAECDSLDGHTAFFPGQPCSTTVCMVNCTICGTKFSDLNHDGIKQNGEPALAGWTILLSYPNNVVYATAVTDAQGNYCFTGVPCGPWLVSELHQPGWVQTFPSTAAHTLNTTTGSTTNNVNFGNYACATSPPCATPPTGLAAWWPFSDDPLTGTAMDVAHGNPAKNGAHLNVTGSVPGELCLTSPAEYAIVPAAEQQDLDFGDGSFAITAWLNMGPAGAGARIVADQRAPDTSLGVAGTRGWALYLDGMQSYLAIGTGGEPQVALGPILAANTWAHIVVSVDRANGEGRWYMNGIHESAFDFTPIAGSVDNAADLRMGQANPEFGGGLAFHGCIGDLALFDAPISADAAYKAWLPGVPSYCPEYALMPAVTTLCPSQTSATVCFKIVNNTATPQSYHWSLAPLTAGPGCTIAGPQIFTPSAGSVTVPAASTSAAICVTVQRPANLTAQNATACFQLTFSNDVTGICRTRTSKLRADNTCWCATANQPTVVGVAARVANGATIGIGVGVPCDPIARAFQWRAVWLDDDHPDPQALSLNGLPPGEPVLGTLSAAPGSSELLSVQVSYPNGYDPTAIYEIVLEADTEGLGIFETLGGIVVHPVSDAGTSSTPSPSPPARPGLELRTSPNPFLDRTTIAFTLARATTVSLGVYDLSGRLVRRIAGGPLDAGEHKFDWDGRGESGSKAAAGIYFVRLGAGGRKVQGKIVKAE